jgi:orotidine-5'-phosphate decarboxylase
LTATATIADRLIVALDVPDTEAARTLARRLSGTVTFFKIGWWLLLAPGIEALLDDIAASGARLFLDAKLHDIPETVAHGAAAAARRGARILTVHAADPAMLRAAVEAAGPTCGIYAVTVLTSLDDATLRAEGHTATAETLIHRRAATAAAAGCEGIIASAQDNPDSIRAAVGAPTLRIATPGIRLPGETTHDHRRSADPAQAIRNGADWLVVGRPIVQAADPLAAAETIIGLMAKA